MKKLYERIISSTRNKLVLGFALFIIPFSFAQMVFIEKSALAMEEQLIVTAGNGHNGKKVLLDEILTSIMSAAFFYQSDHLFLYNLKKEYPYPSDSIALYEQIWGWSRNIISVYPGIRRLSIFSDNPYLVETVPFVQRSNGYFTGTSAYVSLREGAFGHWAGVREVARGMDYWNPASLNASGSKDRLIAYTVTLTKKNASGGYNTFLSVEYSVWQIDLILGGDSQIVSALVDKNNVPVDSRSKIDLFIPLLPEGEEEMTACQATLDGDDYLLWVTPLKNGWKLVSAATMAPIMERAVQMRWLGIELMALFCVVFILAVIFISNRFMRRAKRLAEKMSSFDAEKWEPGDPIKGRDEISVIDQAFHSMGQKLTESIRLNYVQEIEKKQAELSRLHVQIRPHFLYNMLSTIAWVIDDQPRSMARAAVENLASFYRYSLAKGREIITLQEEIRIIGAYMELQRLRLKGKVCFVSQVEPMYYGVKIPRLTLQALVENSILYGPGEERSRMVSIVLAAGVKDNRILLSLRDDGVGMSEETLKELREGAVKSARGTGLGYQTINERIRLYFGPEYGLDIHSEPHRGVCTYIYLPIMEE